MRDNGLEIRRIALTRTVFFTNAGEGNYWAAPRAAMSNDGSTVAADSNFGQLGKPRVTLIETGFGSKARIERSSHRPAVLDCPRRCGVASEKHTRRDWLSAVPAAAAAASAAPKPQAAAAAPTSFW